MNRNNLIILGALAALASLFLLFRKRDAIVQAPQIGQVGTAPGPDTTGTELAFKANVFGAYTDLLKTQASLDSRTRIAELQSGNEASRIASQLQLGSLRETETTKRTEILANSQYAMALENARLQRDQQRASNTAGILNALGRALGSIGQIRQGSSSGGASSGGPSSGGNPTSQIPGYPIPSRRPTTRTSDVFRTPPILPTGREYDPWPNGYNPNWFDFGSFNFPGFDFSDPYYSTPYFGDYPDWSYGRGYSGGSGELTGVSFDDEFPWDWYFDNYDPITGEYYGG